MSGPVSTCPTALPLQQRILILAAVVIAHGVLLAQTWLPELALAESGSRTLSVNIVRIATPRQGQPVKPLKTLPPASEHRHTESLPAEAPPPPQLSHAKAVQAAAETVAPAEAESEAAAPEPSALPDREQDYRAAYLDNPQPNYPLLARRMGWQGRVMLDVEVRADGSPGEVILKESSGRSILDDAAIRAVQGWSFVPARRGGFPVMQRFLVPIAFTLK